MVKWYGESNIVNKKNVENVIALIKKARLVKSNRLIKMLEHKTIGTMYNPILIGIYLSPEIERNPIAVIHRINRIAYLNAGCRFFIMYIERLLSNIAIKNNEA